MMMVVTIVVPRSQSPPKTNQETKSCTEKQRAFILTQLCKLRLSMCPTYWSDQRSPNSVRVGFLKSKGGGVRFLRFRTLIGWHLSRGILVSVFWQVVLSTAIGNVRHFLWMACSGVCGWLKYLYYFFKNYLDIDSSAKYFSHCKSSNPFHRSFIKKQNIHTLRPFKSNF